MSTDTEHADQPTSPTSDEKVRYSAAREAPKLYQQALESAKQGHFEAAEEQFHELLALVPGHVGAYCNLGAIYRQMGQPDSAIDCLLQGLNIDDSHPRLHANIGAAFFDKGMLGDAKTAFQKATELDPTLVEAHYNLALLCCQQEDLDHAWNHAKNASELGLDAAAELQAHIETLLDRGD